MLRWIYLGLAIAAAFTQLYDLWLHSYGISQFIEDWRLGNGFIVVHWPMLITPAALIIWIMAEVYVRKDYWVAPICIAATFGIGVSCGLPLYLYLRTRPIK